jgi:UDP-4-amino-4,6-dideoxy-N-acetyl-beta-L-altrosamine N-acetyltransferase
MLKKYKLVPLELLNKETQLQVLKIRNEEYVREWMFQDKEISVKEHFTWVEQLKDDKTQIHLIIIIDDAITPFGSVNIKKIDMINKNAELGFYKTQSCKENRLMEISIASLINYSFMKLGIEKIYSEVFEGNIKSLNLHKKLQFIEEGFMRSHIVRNGERIGVHLFGLLKNEWQESNSIKENNEQLEIQLVLPTD